MKIPRKFKYVISDDLVPILFPEGIRHDKFRSIFPKIVSAGFCTISGENNDILVDCWGESVSLKVKSQQGDNAIIEMMLKQLSSV